MAKVDTYTENEADATNPATPAPLKKGEASGDYQAPGPPPKKPESLADAQLREHATLPENIVDPSSVLRTDKTKPEPKGAYEKLADAQADQYLAMTQALDPLASGAALPGIDASMASGASAMLGGAGAGYLATETGKAQQQAAAAGLTPAMAATGQAEDANQALISKGLTGLGKAEDQEIAAAPYQQLLSSLAAAVPTRLAENYQVPAAATKLLDSTPWGKALSTEFGITGSQPSSASLGLAPPATAATPTSPVGQPETSAAPQS